MNERIKLLADQAGLHDFVLTAMGIDEEVEMFAKLIVRECAQELSKVPGGYDSTVYYKNAQALKKYFGVEE